MNRDTLDGLGFRDDMTLKEARDLLRDYVDDGAPCPCCTQFAKVYKRRVHAAMARDLIRVYRIAGTSEWTHVPSLVGHPGDFPKLVHWDLVEEETTRRPDGGRAGWWRVTVVGERFIRGSMTVTKYARIYDGRLMGFTGDQVTIRDALGSKFDYDELMSM